MTSWSSTGRTRMLVWDPRYLYSAYVELRPNANPQAIEPILTDVLYRNMRSVIEERQAEAKAVLQPLSSVYFDRETITDRIETGNANTVYFLSIIAVIILIIALVNYINLTTAQAFDRKGKSALVNLLALALALSLASLLMPVVNLLAETDLTGDLGESSFLDVICRRFLCYGLTIGLISRFRDLFLSPHFSAERKSNRNDIERNIAKSVGGAPIFRFSGAVDLYRSRLFATGLHAAPGHRA